jgi:ribosomal protein L37AE/L43A
MKNRYIAENRDRKESIENAMRQKGECGECNETEGTGQRMQ